jgi:hypothetical protein
VSVPVELDRLREEIAGFDSDPYLITVSDDGRPHIVAVSWSWQGDELVIPAGNTTTANARARPHVTVLWPPAHRGGFSLIVDAAVTRATGAGEGGNAVAVQPTRAVLHRPATPNSASDSPCGADCVPVLPSVD